jgi:hypothetical protein
MRYRKLTNLGDYPFGNGLLDFYIDVPEAIAQAVKTSLLLWLGEWFLNIDEGTPYMQGILGKYTIETANTTIQDRILSVEGVTNYEDYESTLDPETRGMSVSFKLNTIYGPTQVEINNYATY